MELMTSLRSISEKIVNETTMVEMMYTHGVDRPHLHEPLDRLAVVLCDVNTESRVRVDPFRLGEYPRDRNLFGLIEVHRNRVMSEDGVCERDEHRDGERERREATCSVQ